MCVRVCVCVHTYLSLLHREPPLGVPEWQAHACLVVWHVFVWGSVLSACWLTACFECVHMHWWLV